MITRVVRRTRPKRKDLFRAAMELASSGSGGFKATARRYSLCPEDAEDAYQRALEILITRAPTPDRSELARWLHTVIKHEALAIRRQRERILGDNASPDPSSSPDEVETPEELAPERERVRRSAEALAQLKQCEVQCLLLKAVGYSYDEISARTGYSWTKVNRSLSEGRKRFFERFAQLESGQHCDRFRSLLSAASDGEAAPDEERLLKTHLRACAGCRAALRDYRTIPARVAELLPPAVLLPALERESWWAQTCDSVAFWIGDRSGAIGHKLQQVGEAVSAQKATAVVASTAALTGGAVVHERVIDKPRPHQHRADRPAAPDTPERTAVLPAQPQPPPSTVTQDGTQRTQANEPSPDPAPAGEFSPERTGSQPIAPDRSAATAPSKPAAIAGIEQGGSGTANAGNVRGAAAGAGEFGP
jgi:RNA polymerase sigma factor (sigma-70 family)